MQPSVVCYADVLGYKQLVREAIKADQGDAFLRRMHRALAKSHEAIKEYSISVRDTPLYDVKVFTDNIVVGYPACDGGFAERELLEVLEVFSSFQATMAVHGFLVRGGIAFDQHYMDENVVLGPALLDCVEMDTTGGAPRLAFARSGRQLVDQHSSFYGGSANAPVGHFVLRDADGTYFLNYLCAAFSNFEVAGIDFDLIRGHALTVQSGLAEHAANAGVWSKYEWAARYHNWVCEDFATRNRPTADAHADPAVELPREEAQELLEQLIDVESYAARPARLI